MPELLIHTQNLNYIFGKQQVINDLNLEVQESSIYGFLGPNGAGKSTTIKLLLGLLQVKTTNIFIFGKELKANRHAILAQVGNLIESPSVYSHLTAYENLNYLDYLFKMGKSRIGEVLKIIGLWNDRNKKVKDFSMGMKQRLGIGMAIFHNPQLLFLDEPINGLDPNGVFEIRELLTKLQKEGKTIFLSSHILSEVEKICTHVGIISKGTITYQGLMADLVAKASKKVLIQTNDNLSVKSLCSINGFSVLQNSLNGVEVIIANAEEFNRLVYLLTSNQIKIHNIETIVGDLEEMFFSLTSN